MLVKEFYSMSDLHPTQWVEAANGDEDADEIEDRFSSVPTPLRRGSGLASAAMTSVYDNPYNMDDENQDPLGIKGDITKYLIVTGQEEDEDLFDAVLLSSPTFRPATFLKVVHKNTSYQELLRGMANLEESLEEKSENMRNLVKQNFERFVNAKMAIDGVYDVMKKNIYCNSDMGLKGLVDALSAWKTETTAIFEPVLKAKQEADLLKKRLDTLRQFRFLFQLPITLRDAIRLTSVESAIRDYGKGKAMIAAALDENADGKRTFTSLWRRVEEAISHLKVSLMDQLSDPKISIQLVEKYISYLLEIEASDEPIVRYLKTKQDYLIQNIDLILDQYKNRLRALAAAAPSLAGADALASYQKQMRAIAETPTTRVSLVQSPIWDTNDWLIQSALCFVNTELLAFWAWAFSVLEGKYFTSTSSLHARISEQIHLVFRGVTNRLSELIRELTDQQKEPSKPACSCWAIVKAGKSISCGLDKALDSLEQLHYPAEDMNRLQSAVTAVQRHILDKMNLCTLADLDHHKAMYEAELVDATSSGTTSSVSSASFPTRALTEWVLRLLEECREIFINKKDGLHPMDFVLEGIRRMLSRYVEGYLNILAGIMDTGAANTMTSAKLISIARDVDWIKRYLDKVIKQSENLFTVVLVDVDAISASLAFLEDKMYTGLVNTQGAKFVQLIQENFLDHAVVTNKALPPTHIRAYMYEILMDLVRVQFEMEHAFDEDKSELLTRRLAFLLLHEMRDCLGSLDSVAPGGYLQLYMEIHFFRLFVFAQKVELSSKQKQDALWALVVAALDAHRQRLPPRWPSACR